MPNQSSSQSVNHFASINDFVLAWDGGLERIRPAAIMAKKGDTGEINNEGRRGCSTSQIVTASHPRFYEFIEPGVRPLVRILVEKAGWVTYSSCEGHEGAHDISFRPRSIGLIPRESRERLQQARAMLSAAAATNLQSGASISVVFREEKLALNENSMIECADIVFESTDGNEAAYFSKIDRVTACFCRHLAREIAEHGRSPEHFFRS